MLRFWPAVFFTNSVFEGGVDFSFDDTGTTGIRIGGGNSVGAGLTYDLWAVSFEAGQFKTSYIKSVASPATRIGDDVTCVFTNNTTLKSADHAIVANVFILGDTGSAQRIWYQDGSGANILQYDSSGGSYDYFIGASKASDTGTSQENVFIACGYDSLNGRFMSKNGESIIYNNAALPVGMANGVMHFGGVTNPMYGHIKSLMFYDFATNQDEIAYLNGV